MSVRERLQLFERPSTDVGRPSNGSASHPPPPSSPGRPLPDRSSGSNTSSQYPAIKSPPPVPKKSDKLAQLQLTQQLRPSHPGLPRHQSVNVPPTVHDGGTSIIMIDNDPGSHNAAPPFEPYSSVSSVSDDGQSLQTDGTSISTTSAKNGGQKPQLGRLFSDTVNPLLKNAKQGVDQLVVATKPVRNVASRGLEDVRAGTKAVLDKTGATTVFNQTSDDFSDLKDKMRGKEGLCNKCKSIPVGHYISWNSPAPAWATPLSRTIYHSEWCRGCRLFLEMLCAPSNDPLRHPAISPYVQDELKGWTMSDWIAKGWAYTDSHWPFGHGEKRHEGASYVLGTGGEVLRGIAERTTALAVRYVAIHTINPKKRLADISRDTRHREQLKAARNPPRYPLSCVITLTTDNHRPGMLTVSLLGYGRKLGADVQVLSTFRLRAVQSSQSIPLIEGRAPSMPFSYGQTLDPNWIDPSVGRMWLHECETRHGLDCQEHGWAIAMKKPGFLRVVDVEDLCVKQVAKPEDCRFIALSYVWGGVETVKLRSSNMHMLMEENGLRRFMRALPQTIIDAIEVVRRLGERYLWTDALCILQETQEAVEQVACMDRIFGSAVATIVAAQGETADAGLEGVRQSFASDITGRQGRPRRLDQIIVHVKDDVSLAAPLWTTDHGVETSVWNSRQWTFQERLLSRRLIIFSHGQMIWHCRKMICREDMPVEDSGIPYKPLQWLSLKPQHMGVGTAPNWKDGSIEITRDGNTHLVRSAAFGEYTRAIEEYTHRKLSFELDILNAFAGLSEIFSLCFKGKMFIGLPQTLLDVAILWRPTQQLQRRKGFPSWSWCGWIGQTAYDQPFKVTRDRDGQFVAFEQSPNGEEGIRPLIRWHFWDPSSRKIIPINGNGLGFPYEGKFLPAGWENGPYSFDTRGDGAPRPAPPISLDGLPFSGLALTPRLKQDAEQLLIFQASTSTSLRLGSQIHQASDQRWTATTSPAPLRYTLLSSSFSSSFSNSPTEEIGTILLDSSTSSPPATVPSTYNDRLHRGQYEFIQIAEAQYFGRDGEIKDIEDCPLYVVMLIEWVTVAGVDERNGGAGRKVAKRLGLGRIWKTAWMLCEPRLRVVCLG